MVQAPVRDGFQLRAAPRVLFVALAATGIGALVLSLRAGTYAPRGTGGPYAYNWIVLLLFVPYAFALHAWSRGEPPRLRTTLIASALLAVPFMFAVPLQSHDLYLYVLYAKMQLAHGANPFVTPPLRVDPWGVGVAWRDRVSAYGPLWILLVTVVVRATGVRFAASLVGVRAAAVGLEAGGLASLGRILEGSPGPSARLAAAAFAFNPLVLSAVALGGHADIAVACAFVWAIAADRRGHPVFAALCLAAAGLVKVYALLPLAVYLLWIARRRGFRSALGPASAAAALAALAFAPYWEGLATLRGLVEAGAQTSSSLAGVLGRGIAWFAGRFPFVHEPSVVSAVVTRSAGIVVVAAMLVALWRSAPKLVDPWKAAVVGLVVLLLVSPWFLPWYLLGPLALLAGVEDAALATAMICFSGTALVTIPGALSQTVARYGPPLAVYRVRRPLPRSADRV